MATRYLLRGARGYVSGLTTGDDFTPNHLHAHSWVTSEAAHAAARQWHQLHKERLSVVIREAAPQLSPDAYTLRT